MTTSLLTEQLLSLPQAARRLPPYREGRPVNPSTIWRWICEGVVIPSGERIRLEGIRVGSRWLTSVEALVRFAAAQTPDLHATPVPNFKTPASRMRAAQRAGDKLGKVGI